MRTWLITGANRGLGYEIAKSALLQGDQVIATARNVKHLHEKFEGFHPRVLTLSLDVTDSTSISLAIDKGVKQFGQIDILVNNAGFGQLGPFEQISEQAVERQFQTNVFGVFAVTRAVLPIMRSQRSGHIISITSLAGLKGMGGSSIYCASKFAVEGWSEALREEVDQFGIKVSLVEPGQFRTDFLDKTSVQYADTWMDEYADYAQAQRSRLDAVSHQQLGHPEKLGAAVLALVDAKSPPTRLPLGSDAYAVLIKRSEQQRLEAQAWRELSLSTDFPSN
ncbi:Short-chain dehydrogenase [Pseudomonas sp. NFACC02]|uniref:oxidoreductase n=1 Tax=Pseudomonas sp. NFACC02 TaxID=1566250 RepID=UPI0008C4A5F9|nr:oxidoreductase [Pseudomonas sp. NFACC02]SER47831.1 Short-chain dehydrogenase [Pseudomonas sp. NFACC02]